MADHLIHLGNAFRGNITWSTIKPSKKKLREGIFTRGEAVAKELKIAVLGCLTRSGCAFTTDIWSCSSNRHSYMPVTCHWFDTVGILHEGLLSFKLWKSDDNKTGILIRASLHEIFVEMGMGEWLHRTVFVTDRGSNIIKAFENSGEI